MRQRVRPRGRAGGRLLYGVRPRVRARPWRGHQVRPRARPAERVVPRPADRVAQRGHELGATRVALLGRLGQRPHHHGVDLRRQLGPDLRQRCGLLGQVRPEQRDVVLPLERQPRRQPLVDHAGQGVLVAAAVDVLLVDLLGRHVAGRADELVGLRQPGDRRAVLGDAEVGQVDVVAGQQDVGRLDVAVDQVVGVGGVERGGHLGEDLVRLADRQRPPVVDEPAHVEAVDVAHGDVEDAVGVGVGLVDRDDVGVLDAGDRPGLQDEALPEPVVDAQHRVEDLQRHPAAQPRVECQVDDGHAALADDVLDVVPGHLLADERSFVQWHHVSMGWPQ